MIKTIICFNRGHEFLVVVDGSVSQDDIDAQYSDYGYHRWLARNMRRPWKFNMFALCRRQSAYARLCAGRKPRQKYKQLRRQSAYTRACARPEYKPGLILFVEEPIVRNKSTEDIIFNSRCKIFTFCAFVWLTGAPWICKATSIIYWEYDDVNFNFCLMATRWHNATNQKWLDYSFPCDVIIHQYHALNVGLTVSQMQ